MSDKMSIDKNDPAKDDSDESLASSPADLEPGPSAQPESQPAKRKGGRKPIYATSEERKQRNRQAQAAFRERRTEYIKQLEETIRIHESNLNNLQTAHRGAADECLMLRYKNSLLERILLEKGIDVQAELRAKTGSPNLGPTHMPQNMVQPPPIQRAILSRQNHARRSASNIAPKIEPSATSAPPQSQGMQHASSPKARPTPPSHAASPTTSTPGFNGQVTSPTVPNQPGARPGVAPSRPPQMAPMPGMSAAARQQMMQQQQQQQPPPPQQANPQQPQPQQKKQQQQPHAQAGFRPPSVYPTQSFQSHYEQLDQEYDAPNDAIDDVDPDTPGPSPYTTAFPNAQPPAHGLPVQQAAASVPPPQAAMPSGEQGAQTQGQGYPSMTQLLDPALDWDPFGLSASMAFPTQFSFDTSNMR